jgi:nitroreductase
VDLLRGQRAYRDLLPDPVPDEVIERVLEAATHAPSAENTQPWEFVVITDPAVRADVGRMTREMWEGGGREYAARHVPPKMLDEVSAWASGGLASAPVHVVVCGDTAKVHASLLPSSIYPAVQSLLLAAIAEGLGSLLSTLPLVNTAAFASLLGLPDNVTPMALVPIGYPRRTLKPGRRIPVAEKTHRDRWGNPWSGQ